MVNIQMNKMHKLETYEYKCEEREPNYFLNSLINVSLCAIVNIVTLYTINSWCKISNDIDVSQLQ